MQASCANPRFLPDGQVAGCQANDGSIGNE